MNVFYARISEGCIVPRMMCLAYRDYPKNNSVFVLFPFHYAFIFAFWLNQIWAKYRFKPSWIDKQVSEKN